MSKFEKDVVQDLMELRSRIEELERRLEKKEVKMWGSENENNEQKESSASVC